MELLNQTINDIPPQNRLQALLRRKRLLGFVGVLIFLIFLTLTFAGSSPPPKTEQTIAPQPSITAMPLDAELIQPTILSNQKKQQNADENVANWERSVYANYPWINVLPLRTETYFVYFDVSTKKFIGLLYPGPDDDSEQMKVAIFTELQNKGAKIDVYPIEWHIQD